MQTSLFEFQNFQRAPVLEAWVGLRPGRPSARLEKELWRIKDKFGRERSLKVSTEYGTDDCKGLLFSITKTSYSVSLLNLSCTGTGKL